MFVVLGSLHDHLSFFYRSSRGLWGVFGRSLGRLWLDLRGLRPAVRASRDSGGQLHLALGERAKRRLARQGRRDEGPRRYYSRQSGAAWRDGPRHLIFDRLCVGDDLRTNPLAGRRTPGHRSRLEAAAASCILHSQGVVEDPGEPLVFWSPAARHLMAAPAAPRR